MLKNVISVTTASAIVLALSFALVTVVSAASITNVEFSNGDVTVQGTAGQNIGGKVRVVVGPSEVVEKMEFDILGDNLAPVCVDVGGDKGLEEGTHFVQNPGDLKFPPNTGTYTLAVKGSGIYGAFKTVDCTTNVVGSASFSGAVKTVGVNSNNNSSVGSESLYQQLLTMIGLLKAQVDGLVNPVVPVASDKCNTLSTKLVGTMDNTYNNANVKLQGYLLSEGLQIPALEAGSAFGYKGSQTNSALLAYKSLHQCI